MGWDRYPNLRSRPSTPTKGRGPVQRAIRRAFIASGAEAHTSSQVYDWAYIRCRLGRCKTLPDGVYSRAQRTLRMMCEPVGRSTSIGRPTLWRLGDTGEP
jgi:hypothetical protein